MARNFLIGILGLIGLASVYAMMPTSTEGLSAAKPKLKSLAGVKGTGCGVIGLDRASSTTCYETTVDPTLRKEIEGELTAMGFEADGNKYTRATGWLFPVRSSVIIKSDRVYVGASRCKCPFK